MSMVAGNVAVNQTSGNETFTPPTGANLAKEWYVARVAAAGLPDPSNPPKSTLTSPASVGDMVLTVDATLGWTVGRNIQISYGATSYWAGTTFTSSITALTSTSITMADALPVALPNGTIVGYTGSPTDWQNQALPQLIKQKTSIASACNVDAMVIVAHIQANATAHISTSLGGLQESTSPSFATDPPSAPADIPIQ